MQTPTLLVRNGCAGFEEGREGGGMAVVGEWDECSAGFGVRGIYVGGELCGEDGGSM